MPFPFLRLPAELRNKIYGYLLIPPATCEPTTTHRYFVDLNVRTEPFPPQIDTKILLVNKLISKEASAIIYDHTVLSIHLYEWVPDYDSTILSQLGALKYGDIDPARLDNYMIYLHILRQLSEIRVVMTPYIKIDKDSRPKVRGLMLDRIASFLDIIDPRLVMGSHQQVPLTSLKLYFDNRPSNTLEPGQIVQARKNTVAELEQHDIITKLRRVHEVRCVELRGDFLDGQTLRRLNQMVADT